MHPTSHADTIVLNRAVDRRSQWDNYLLPYLSGVSVEACSTLCDDVQQLYCEPCGADAHCLDCHSCLLANNDPFMNMQGRAAL